MANSSAFQSVLPQPHAAEDNKDMDFLRALFLRHCPTSQDDTDADAQPPGAATPSQVPSSTGHCCQQGHCVQEGREQGSVCAGLRGRAGIRVSIPCPCAAPSVGCLRAAKGCPCLQSKPERWWLQFCPESRRAKCNTMFCTRLLSFK